MTTILRTFVVAAIALGAPVTQGQIINESLSGGTAVQPGAASTSRTESEQAAERPYSWMIPKVTLPKVTMPKIQMPKMPANAFAPVKSSVAKVKNGATRAWEGTKELLSFGRNDSEPPARVAASKQPSMLERMFGAEEAQNQPQTMAEFISQPRPQ